MELHLTHETRTLIRVTCDDQYSHSFDLLPLVLSVGKEQLPPEPITYGQTLYNALFAPEMLAHRVLAAFPDRIVLIATDDDLDAIHWEYIYGPDGFLVQEYHFVRGLPSAQRLQPPALDTGLHIVAVPSNPLSSRVAPLNIEAEWMRLKDTITSLSFSLTLEHTRPPTIEQLRNDIVGQRHRVVHFMGHGGQLDNEAVLCFEHDNGELDLVKARQFVLRVRDSVFLVVLNACMSAAPGSTAFSNFAFALVRQRLPYALGMRLSILDDDARVFSRAFYDDLTRGASVEEALRRARLALASSPRSWVIGIPILYTSLAAPASGFLPKEGMPYVIEHQPRMEVSALPRAEGGFQGRIEDLKQLGSLLTGDNRPGLLTIQGGGGQGKTALAREAVERFAYAWPAGVWATTLENLPERGRVAADLARFLDINTQEMSELDKIEHQVLTHLTSHRVLIVLDNAETLVEAVEANDAQALRLVQFLKQLFSTSASFLVTSRIPLGWSGEIVHELGGLTEEEGAHLFRQSAPQRKEALEEVLAKELSKKVEGHPLALRLLGGAFNAEKIPLSAFLQQSEEQLVQAEDKYVGQEHRHRKLYACIEISLRYLNHDLRDLLSGLWIFHSPFLAITAVAMFDPVAIDTEEAPSLVHDQLHALWQRGLLTCSTIIVRDDTLQFYHLLPTTRHYVKRDLSLAYSRDLLEERFNSVYGRYAHHLCQGLDSSGAAAAIARQTVGDLKRISTSITEIKRAYYLLDVAEILHWLGEQVQSLKRLESIVEFAQEQGETELSASASGLSATIYQTIGQRQWALSLFEQTLLVSRAKGDRVNEAITLSNMAEVYRATGQRQCALDLFEQALTLMREVGNRHGEAITLHGIAGVYHILGQSQQALRLLEQASSLMKEVGDYDGVALTLNGMAEVYKTIGQRQRALDLYTQALSIVQEIGNHTSEAETYIGMAELHLLIGQPQQALHLFKQASFLAKEVQNRPVESRILNGIAGVYQTIGQPQKALSLYVQALSLKREVGDRTGEATVLNNMAAVYWAIGQPQQATDMWEKGLSLMQEGGYHSGEATLLLNMAVTYQNVGQFQRALDFCEKGLSMIKEEGNRSGEASALAIMANLYQHMGQLEQAQRLYELALPLMKDVQDRSGERNTLGFLAAVYQALNQPQRALSLYKQALHQMREAEDRVAEAALLQSMATVYQTSSQLQRALDLYEQALLLKRATGERSGEVTLFNRMAVVYQVLGQLPRAFRLLEQALSIAREIENRDLEAITIHNQAAIYQASGQTREALRFYEQALHIRREVENRTEEATTLNNMGEIYRITGKPQQALKLYEQALSLMREVKNRTGEAITLSNRATIYQTIGQPQRALNLYQQALSLKKEVGDRNGEAITLSNIANLYQTMGQLQQALELYEQALQIMQQIGNRGGEAITLNGIGQIYGMQGKHQQALNFYEQALPISKAIGDRFNEAIILSNQANIHGVSGQPQRALALYEQALSLRREVNYPAGEVVTLTHMSLLLHQKLNRSGEAIVVMKQAIELLKQTQLYQDSAGHTLAELRKILHDMSRSSSNDAQPRSGPTTLTPEKVEQIIVGTAAVLAAMREWRAEWRANLVQLRNAVRTNGRKEELALLDAIIALLDAEGNPKGLGMNLTGPAMHAWQRLLMLLQQSA